jgi:hypothetical protein
MKRITAARLLLKGGRAFFQGRRRDAVGLLVAAAVSTRSAVLGMLAEAALRLYRRRAGRGGKERPPGRAAPFGRGGR